MRALNLGLSFSAVCALLFASCFALGCKKDPPRETIPKVVLDRQEGKTFPEPAEPVAKATPSETKPAPPPPPMVAEMLPDVPEFPDTVRPPLADDLGKYLDQVTGDGALVADFETSMGTITCTLATETPVTVANFLGLALGAKPFTDPTTGEEARRRFYDGTIFHRVIPRFMIQGGDPLGVGRGGPGYKFENEIVPRLKHSKAGVLAMANAGPGTNGSQFYITEVATPHLDGRHTVFGYCDNVDIVRKIARVEASGGGKPAEDVILNRVGIRRDSSK